MCAVPLVGESPVSRIVYVNGQFLPRAHASVSIEDRGYQFSDGVYEVCLFLNGKPLDFHLHMDRLDRSLAALSINPPMGRGAFKVVMDQMMRRNRLRDATIYLQITRGVTRRDHAFPAFPPAPAIVMAAQRFNVAALREKQKTGVAVISTPDLRWKRCDIKTVSLLGNVLAKQAAREAGALEGWMVDAQGFVTEGSSSTAWIVDQQGRLRTRRLAKDILPGITRHVMGDIAANAQIAPVEEPFTIAEAQSAKEAFIASTTSSVTPVTQIDGVPVGDGTPGPVTRDLIDRHWRHVLRETGYRL
ncbi:D-alanine aminotransferase [Iodidimonas gelatinilytica]|uniref:Probable branched-chain-amino-acid aminotransferase n=1 Tax=Iodidimonas gelatinilytica TaxID=1236966 RepID=A0A5A7MM22_9PROT|nr:D-alanine aminotransferase [Iodidimonas gelatinilytica]